MIYPHCSGPYRPALFILIADVELSRISTTAENAFNIYRHHFDEAILRFI